LSVCCIHPYDRPPHDPYSTINVSTTNVSYCCNGGQSTSFTVKTTYDVLIVIADLQIIPPALPTKYPPLSPRLMLWDHAPIARSAALLWLLLVLTKAATFAFPKQTPVPLVLAEANATAFFALALHSLVLADAATTTFFTPAPQSLVHVDATAAAVLTLAPPPLVFTEDRGLAGLLDCRGMWRQSCS